MSRRWLGALLACLTVALAAPAVSAADSNTASISGTVTDFTTGQPVSGYVQLFVDGYYSSYAQIASNGTYTVSGLSAGTYTAEFEPDDGHQDTYYDGTTSAAAATQIPVSDGQAVTGIDGSVHLLGTITGTISDANGPVQGASVTATAPDGQIGYGYTGANGVYTIHGQQPGNYTVYANANQAADAPEYYHQKLTAASADPVAVSLDTTSSGIDITLPPAASISGTPSDAGNPTGVCNVNVNLYGPDGSVLTSTSVYCGQANDQFRFGSLPAGTYKVGFVPQHNGNGQPADGDLPTFYGGTSLASATPITVTAGQAFTGANATLPTGAVITGTVTNDIGESPTGTTVSVVDAQGAAHQAQVVSGRYTVEGLASGSYTVSASRSYYTTTYYPSATSQSGAQPVTVTAPNTTPQINLTLSLAQGVSGQITDSAGNPLSGATVSLEDGNGNAFWTDTTTAAGRYELPTGLATGYLYVEPPSSAYQSAFYDNANFGGPPPIRLTSSAPLATANVSLTSTPTGAAVSGTVTGPSGPLSGVTVTAYDASGAVAAQTSTAADGTYTISPLRQGRYRFGFADATQTVYYQGETTLAAADPVPVGPPGAIVAGIDAQLGVAGGGSGTGSAGTGGTGSGTVTSTSDGAAPPIAVPPGSAVTTPGPSLGGLVTPLPRAGVRNLRLPLAVGGAGYAARSGLVTVVLVCGAPAGCPVTVTLSRGRRRLKRVRVRVTSGRHAVPVTRVRSPATLALVVSDADGTLLRSTLTLRGTRSAHR